MTPERLATCLTRLGWSAAELGTQAGIHERQCRRMLAGQATVPPPIGEWLERLTTFHECNPAPERKA